MKSNACTSIFIVNTLSKQHTNLSFVNNALSDHVHLVS